MGDPYTRWGLPTHGVAQPGMSCRLDECRHGWLVSVGADVVEHRGTYEKRSRVYREGDDSLQLLDNSTVVTLVDPKRLPIHHQLNPGDVVRVLYPSKQGGRVGVIVKGDYRFTMVTPGYPPYFVDADYLSWVDGELVVKP